MLQQKDKIKRAKQILEDRRNRLKALYEYEMDKWKTIIIESQHETIEERMNKIRDKAHRLKEQRERERQSFVNNCYYRQWRDGCDEARKLESKAVIQQVIKDRELCDNVPRDSDVNGPLEQLYLTSLPLWADEEAEIKEQLEKNSALRQALDYQVSFNKETKQQQENMQKEEEKELLASWKREMNEAKRQELQRVAEARATGLKTLQTNKENLKAFEQERHEEHKRDIVLLNYAMKKEEDEIKAEIDKKERAQEETRQYTKFLREQMIRESIDTGELDAIRNREEERIWLDRDAKLKAQDDARNRLLREVQEGRALQMYEKQKLKELEEQIELEELTKRLAVSRKEDEEEKLKKEAMKQRTMQDTEYIRKQIEHKQCASEVEQQKKYLHSKVMAYAEKRQKQKLNDVTFS